MKLSLAARFWAKVEITSSCWLWTGAKRGDGYGHCFYSNSPANPEADTYASPDTGQHQVYQAGAGSNHLALCADSGHGGLAVEGPNRVLG